MMKVNALDLKRFYPSLAPNAFASEYKLFVYALQRQNEHTVPDTTAAFCVVCTQFPDQMERLRPCTQLYVSIDASNPVELKAVDRPIFSDFWERFLACVDLLAKKGQR